MLNQIIWWGSITLEVALLARGLRARLVFRYPTFYCYIAFVLLQDLSRFLAYQRDFRTYQYTYWATEFMCVLIGCGIIFEVYRVALQSFPGTAHMARNLLALVFALTLAKAIANSWGDPKWWLGVNALEAERDLRVVEALAIFGLVSLFLFYAIPFGRNLRGILIGYGLFIAVRIISLPFAPAHGQRDFWAYLYSASYLLALGVWLVLLWSYRESPVLKSAGAQLENDYQRLAAATRSRLQAARGQLAKAVRS
jgi:hypothetical protein